MKAKESIQTYLDEIGRHKQLSDDEERQLATRIAQGDDKASSRLVEANLPFVVSLARQYKDKGVALDDLISEGNLGMLQAAAKYDGKKRFVTYAAPYIREAMTRAIDQVGLYRVPRHAADADVERKRSRALSIDAPVGGSTELSLGRVVPDVNAPDPGQQVESDEQREALTRALGRLDERSRRVMSHLYGLGTEQLTMAETAQAMGIKRERVRQIRDRAMRIIRKK